MAELLGVVLQFLAELLIQIVGEALVELGVRGAVRALRRRPRLHPVVSVLVYLAFGAGVGAVSVALFPRSLISHSTAKALNLLLTPLLAGLLMGWLGAWRRRRGQELIRLDSFNYGFAFALAMAAVRYFWTHG